MTNFLYLFLMILLITYLWRIIKKTKLEHLNVADSEAIRNIASLYNNNNMIVGNFTSTGEAIFKSADGNTGSVSGKTHFANRGSDNVIRNHIAGTTNIYGVTNIKGSTNITGNTTINNNAVVTGTTSFKGGNNGITNSNNTWFPGTDGNNYIRGRTIINGLVSFDRVPKLKIGLTGCTVRESTNAAWRSISCPPGMVVTQVEGNSFGPAKVKCCTPEIQLA